MKKKILALALALSMTVGLLAGCGSSGSSSGENKDTVTLTVYSQLANYSGLQDGWFAKLLLDKFNCKINIVSETGGILETRMEAGDLGDIVVWGSDGGDYLNAINAGLLLDWEEDDLLADYGEDIMTYFPDAIEKNRTVSGDGHVYGIGHAIAPSNDDHQDFMYSWDLRWDLYEKLGCPEIKDLDDYYDMFVAMKELCPTDDNGNPTYAFSIWPDWDSNMVMYVKSMVTAYYGYDEFDFGNLDPVTGTYYDCLDPDGPYIEMLRFFNKLYRADLLDPESMDQNYNRMAEKLASGAIFASIFNYAGSAGFNTAEHIAANEYMTAVAPEEANPIVYGLSTLGGNRIWSIGSKTQDPELCMEIINWLSTPEGYLESEYGPKGVVWDYDENGYLYFTDFGKEVRENGDSLDMSTGSDYSGFYNDGRQQINNITWAADAKNPDSTVGETFNYKYWASTLNATSNESAEAWREKYGVETVAAYMEQRGKYSVMPETTYSEAERSDELELTWNNVKNDIVNGSWKCIYAKNDGEFEYLLNDMIEKAGNHGYDECVAWSTEQAAIKYALIEEAK